MERKYIHRFSEIGDLPFALEYGDIDLKTVHTELSPISDISLKTYLTNSYPLNGILVGAPMHTTSEANMCIAMGLSGNCAVLHKNMSIDKQVEEGKKVKRFSSGFITEPDTLSPKDTVYKTLAIKKEKGYDSFPITKDGSPHGKLVGLFTKFYCSEKYKDYKVKEFMIPIEELKEEGILHSKKLDIHEAEEMMRKNRYGKLLIVDENGYLESMSTWADVSKREEFPDAVLDKYDRIKYGAALGGPGSIKDFKERSRRLVKEANVDALFIETAQADSDGVMKKTKKLLDDLVSSYDVPVVYGNVDNYESASRLASICRDMDAIKVGIGPGSICTTKQVTGAGIPQLTAVWECSKAAKEAGIRCIADGGIGRTPVEASGNAIKAIAAGADTVMVGGLIAGTKECPMEPKLNKEGKWVSEYDGMASPAGLEAGGGTRYYQKGKDAVIQGIEDEVSFKGSVFDVIREFNKNVRYSKAIHYNIKKIEDLQKADLEFAIKVSVARKVA